MTVTEAWRDWLARLDAVHAGRSRALRPGATDAQFAAVGVALPEALRELYALHDGENPDAPDGPRFFTVPVGTTESAREGYFFLPLTDGESLRDHFDMLAFSPLPPRDQVEGADDAWGARPPIPFASDFDDNVLAVLDAPGAPVVELAFGRKRFRVLAPDLASFIASQQAR